MADKKAVGLLLGIGGPKPEPEGESLDAATVAAEAVFEALDSRDAAAFADAMRSMVAACKGGEDY